MFRSVQRRRWFRVEVLVNLVGIDGCKGGWISISSHRSVFEARISSNITDALKGLEEPYLVGIDIPIGLPDTGKRQCDTVGRRFLGRPRGSSVFSAPVRGVLNADLYEDAGRLHRLIDGRGLSRQSFAIIPKIREVDEYLRLYPNCHARTFEVHPEVSFATWNDNEPMAHSKRSTDGVRERRRLVEEKWPGAIEELIPSLERGAFAVNDLLDAFAALWSIERLHSNSVSCFPDGDEFDGCNLRMQIIA
jgi:predicted RNase H-like nuclease